MADVYDIHCDASRFKKKLIKVNKGVALAVKEATMEGAQFVYDEMAKNLRGPHIGKTPTEKNRGAIGTMPIPRRTGQLARSAYIRPVTSYCMIVGSDSRIARYNKAIHDGVLGTKRIPRRFLGDVVTKNRRKVQNMMRTRVNRAIAEAQRMAV